MKELVGKYLNGYRIAKVEKDPFIEGQINLWTDDTKLDFLGNREVIKFYIRDYPSSASIYQEQVDKENYQLKSIINELKKRLEVAIEDNKKEYSLKSQMAVFVLRDVLELIEELLDKGE